jgi:hypothetical protein
LSGEIKGKALAKVNQQAFEEYNDSALVACPYCTRWVILFTGVGITLLRSVAPLI